MSSRRLALLGTAVAALGASAARPQDAAQPSAPAPLRVAVYRSFPPFSDSGRGIDVELARQLAVRLGRPLELIAYWSGESVEADLRYVLSGGRRADVAMHVPYAAELAQRTPEVRLLAPYYRERIVLVFDPHRVPDPPSLEAFITRRIGTQLGTVADAYLMSALAGSLQHNVRHYLRPREMVADLDSGAVDALMGEAAALEAALVAAGSSGRYRLTAPPRPGPASAGWDIGLAIRRGDDGLADAVRTAIADLRREGTIARLFKDRGLTYTPPRAADGEVPEESRADAR